jgi:hypothetical protein
MRTAFRDGRDVEVWCLDEETASALAKRIAQCRIRHIEDFKVSENDKYNSIQRKQRYDHNIYTEDLQTLDELKDENISIQIFACKYSTNPDHELQIPQQKFIQYLQLAAARKVTRKEYGGLFGAYRYKNDATNCQISSIDYALAYIPLDVDNADLDVWINRIRALGINAIMYNSFNSTLEQPRCRVIFQTDRPMPLDVYRRISKQCAAWIGLPVDPNSHNRGQRFYLPVQANAGANASFFHVIEGKKLDVKTCLEEYWNSNTVEAKPQHAETNETIVHSYSVDQEQMILNRESMGLDLSYHHDRATFIKRALYCGINPERARRQLRWKHSTTARQAADFASYMAFARRNGRRPRLR